MEHEKRHPLFETLSETCLEFFRKGQPVSARRILTALMDRKEVPSHSPLHHFLMPAALLTAAFLAEDGREEVELAAMLGLAWDRALQVPAGACGNLGACGAGVGAGIFMSVYTGASPHTKENWKWCNEITARCLAEIAQVEGPCCCKRTSFLTLRAAEPYIAERLGLRLPPGEEAVCTYFRENEICKGRECPFFPV